jgi:hypothetical protein
MNKKYDLPAVNTLYLSFAAGVTKFAGNFQETFQTFSCPVMDLTQPKLLEGYTSKKYNFTAVNTHFISINPGKFPWGNFLRRKIPQEIFLTILVNLGNFFRQGTISENFGENLQKFYLHKVQFTSCK